MICSCRKAAIRIFVRSTTRLYANETLAAAQTASRPNHHNGHHAAVAGWTGRPPSSAQLSLIARRRGRLNYSTSSGNSVTPDPTELGSAQGDSSSVTGPTHAPGSVSDCNSRESSKPKKQKRTVLSEKPPAPPPTEKEDWQIQKVALKAKFGEEGWKPRKRLSPDALAGIRALNRQFPDVYTTEELSKRFEVSPEAIRRILKSKWEPTAEEEEERQKRWFERGLNIWKEKAEKGAKPPKKWREAGVRTKKTRKRRTVEARTEADGTSKFRRKYLLRGIPRRSVDEDVGDRSEKVWET